MKKILIIGCPGSGKSTLAKFLSKKLHLPLIYLDRLYWKDNWQTISHDEFDRLLLEELNKPEWIIDGNYNRTIPLRLQYCDTVIFLDLPRITCLLGVLKRVVLTHGKTRSDMGKNCPEHFDFNFLKFIWNFNRNNRCRYYNLLKETKNLKIIILKSRGEVSKFLNNL